MTLKRVNIGGGKERIEIKLVKDHDDAVLFEHCKHILKRIVKNENRH